jgi:hypothetical protein
VWPLLAPAALVLVSTALVYGTPRFRAPAEPSVVVLAAVGAAVLLSRRWPALEPGVAEVEPGPASPPA